MSDALQMNLRDHLQLLIARVYLESVLPPFTFGIL